MGSPAELKARVAEPEEIRDVKRLMALFLLIPGNVVGEMTDSVPLGEEWDATRNLMMDYAKYDEEALSLVRTLVDVLIGIGSRIGEELRKGVH